MEKLAACGIYGHLLEWLTSFLHGRSQSVAVNGQESIPTPVRAGVPQGSVLGPTLFLVFLRDMGEGLRSELDHYADDSTLYHVIDNRLDRSRTADIINEDLCSIQRWADT